MITIRIKSGFIDDETWISGDFGDENPDLLINLFDENGITYSRWFGHWTIFSGYR
ncbi:MAG: hypothetical protein R2728_07560 [Chitinophagales bacterium]